MTAKNFKVEGQGSFNGIVSTCRFSAVGLDWTAIVTQLDVNVTIKLSVDASSVGIGSMVNRGHIADDTYPTDVCSWILPSDIGVFSGALGDTMGDSLTSKRLRAVASS